MKSPDRIKVTFGTIPEDEKDLALLNSIKFIERPASKMLWAPSTLPKNSRFKELYEQQKDFYIARSLEVPEKLISNSNDNKEVSNMVNIIGPIQVDEPTVVLVDEFFKNSDDKSLYQTQENGTGKKLCGDASSTVKTQEAKKDLTDITTDAPSKPLPEPKAAVRTWAVMIGKHSFGQKNSVPSRPEQPALPSPPKSFISKAKNISELFRDTHISMRSPLVEPRGITNNNLLCYAHSVIQSLIHVPPFLNLIKLLISSSLSDPVQTPILFAFSEIFKHFKLSTVKKSKSQREQEPIEPKFIIKLVHSLKPSFTTQIGVQEDSHEFFSALINGLNDELLALMKKESIAIASNYDSSKSPSIHIFQTEQPGTDSDDAEWVGVGANNKHFISRESKVSTTPITSLFSGLYRNTIKVKGKAPSVSQDCSIDLQLEVEPEHIKSVQDALDQLLQAEDLEKSETSNDLISGSISKHFSFDVLPPILVLHLKIVVYCKAIEGARKILKDISCPPVLSFPGPKKSGTKEISVIKYQLVAVVYHHGAEAMAGHYTCDVRRGDNSWIFCNDSEIEALDTKAIGTTEHTLDGTPYILFYTRI